MIPQSFKDDLLASVDIVDVVSPHVELKKSGNSYTGLCPFHDERTPSFNVVPHKRFFYCHGCGKNGDAIGFLMMHLGLKYRDAIKELAEAAGMQLPARPTSMLDQQAVRKRMDAEAALICLEPELWFMAVCASDYHQGRTVSVDDHARLFDAIGAVLRCIELAKGRPLTKHERRVLTQQEEADLEAIT